MPGTQNMIIAIAAGAVVIAGALYLEKDNLGLSSEGIRSVDFRNNPVEVVGTACADPQLTTAGITRLPLHEGAYQLGQYQFELVGDVRYGDVSGHTGDNASEKAVFVGSCSNAGKTSQVLFVYGMKDDKPERLGSTDLSASGNTLVQSYSVGDGSIQVKANQGDPPALVTLTYALLNGSLVNLNPPAPQQTVQTTPMPPAPQQTVQTAPMPPESGQGADTSSSNVSTPVDRVDFETFHDELAPYGKWEQHPRWGLVWHPSQVSADFRPYRDGHWEDSDEYGTVWVSDYSWGDIPFHYGRWGYDPGYGWLWQPGYVWSPGWVAWREGAGNIGWFPIPPDYYDGTGLFVDDWDGWYGYRALYGAALDAAAFYALWSFVPADDIYAPSIGVDIIAPVGYGAFIGRTAGWTRFGLARGHLVNRAIDRDRFRAAFGHPLPASNRHDFLAHHGPIVGPARGHLIAAHERLAGHAPAATHLTPATHFRHPGLAHSASHSAFARSSHHVTHSGFAQHTGNTPHTAYGGGAYGRRPAYGGSYGQHSGFSGNAYAQHPGGGNYAQRPAMGGGSGFAQRPSFGGGMMSRPSPGGSARPAPQRPSGQHH